MRYKDMQKAQYQDLAEVFENWYFNKLESIEKNKNIENPPLELLENLNLDKNSFYEEYIAPYKNLSKADLETIFKILAYELTGIYTKNNSIPSNCELKIQYDLSYERKSNALDWLLFQISLLGIFDLSENLKKRLKKPYHQCNYCGTPDFYILKNEQIPLSQKEKFCHKENCKKGSNPILHDNCCYSKWVSKRKTLEKKLGLLKTKISKNQLDGMLIKANISEKYGITDMNHIKKEKDKLKQKTKSAFITFCENQFEENLKINYTIRDEHKKHQKPTNLI